MKDIQGTWVPHAICEMDACMLTVQHTAPALVTEYICPCNAGANAETELYNVRDRVVAAFEAVWQWGVCHGDVAWRNILLSCDGWPVIIDFERSSRNCSKKQVCAKRQQVMEMLGLQGSTSW